MDIRGMVKFSLNDFPGKLALVLFTGGCNLKCAFCHNPHLVFDPESQPKIREQKVFSFLKTRLGKLDGVVISGGEPTLQKDLFEFAGKLREMGFEVKLDTNGSNPDILKQLHEADRVQALGVDYKAPLFRYCEICGSNDPQLPEKVQESIHYAFANKIPLDVRTTVHRKLLSTKDLATMRSELDSMGIREWTLQQFNPVDVIDETLKDIPTYTDSELVSIARDLGRVRVKGLSGVFLNKE